MANMKKPYNWYGFKVKCELYDFGISNMTPSSKQQYCLRKDRDGNRRGKYDDQLKCNWNVCPKLKKQRKVGGFKGWNVLGKEVYRENN